MTTSQLIEQLTQLAPNCRKLAPNTLKKYLEPKPTSMLKPLPCAGSWTPLFRR
jgi:hypothetical protein